MATEPQIRLDHQADAEIVGYEFLTRTDLPPLPGMEIVDDKVYWAPSHLFADRVEVSWDQLVAGGYAKPVYRTVENVVYLIQRLETTGRWLTEFNTRNPDDAHDWYLHYKANGPNSAWRLVKTASTETVLETTGG